MNTLVAAATPAAPATHRRRSLLIGLTAFLTLVDLFATQAILPSLAQAYGVTPAAMGVAVNASTFGMAVAGLLVAAASHRLDRRRGIVVALALLALPTAALAWAPDLATFTALRVAQGLCMATAFTLMLSYLAEQCSATEASGAFAAYITGNVASNLVGRMLSAALADTVGLDGNFLFFALLNGAGAVLVYFSLAGTPSAPHAMQARAAGAPSAALGAFAASLREPRLRIAFAIGFLILFAFLGVFTYVNFVLARAPLALAPMTLGLVYFVFAPSIVTTPLAGRAVQRFGTRATVVAALLLALAGLPLLLVPLLPAVLAGMVLVAVGTFFAQAATTGFVGRVADADHATASGLYLASYFCGGLVGAAVVGRLFDGAGWSAAVGGVGAALVAAVLLALRLRSAR